MLKVILKTIGVLLLIAYLAVCGFVWRTQEPPMVYKDVRVFVCDSANAQFVSRYDIMRVVNSADSLQPKGKQVSQFNAYALEQELQKNTLIANADCYPTPDSTLRIDIYQRRPILRIKSSSLTHDYYVDTEGELMAYKPSRKALDIPLATGHISKEMAVGPLFTLAKFLRKHKKWDRDITQIYVASNGDIELIPKRGEHTIILGPIDDYEAKFDRLETFYDKVLDEKGWNTYKTLNLKFKNQVIAEKK